MSTHTDTTNRWGSEMVELVEFNAPRDTEAERKWLCAK